MIEVVSSNNIDEVLPLISKYQEFYKVVDISDAKNKAFFSQFGETNSSGCQFILRNKTKIVGFTTVFFTYSSTLAAKVAVLNDLYILPANRGEGFAKQLVEHCDRFAKSQGALRLQWLTATDNEPAQKLYDSLNTAKSTWCFYTYNT